MVYLKYWNSALQIDMVDWKKVYQFPQKQLMKVEVHQGKLYYREKGSAKRISYVLKKGLIKSGICFNEGTPF